MQLLNANHATPSHHCTLIIAVRFAPCIRRFHDAHGLFPLRFCSALRHRWASVPAPSSRITSSSRSCCVVEPYDHRCLQSLRRSTCEHPVPLAQPLPEGVVLPPFETGACPLRPGGLHPLGEGGRTVRCIVPLRHTLFFPPQTEDSLGFSPVGTWNRRGSLPRPQCPVRPGSDRTRPVWDTTPLEAQTPPTALVRAIDKHKQPTRHTPSIFRTTGWNSRPRPKHPKEERRAKNETPSHEKR